eukprot:CAMPEP_0205907136 /NCGR_PEP_ID=MMETSP1325-20131115/2351_1 /ASSEMBLY_ACC=CAM_ASM_000708 /TAXON_ID=236786 /ORGANISM="Florenciella sp., Strain RCC1007" /LENGTH=58 /DNA_ID=CAMNT_0053273199 /DNA_START=35 /DNA_END=207 /DNA_ORIENTATION=-
MSFIRDITDGYFPAEFKNEYPDGVLLVSHDRRSEPFGEDFEAFKGEGNTLGRKAQKLS